MSTIDHGDTSEELNSTNKILRRKFSTFDKISTVFVGVFLIGILFYDQFTTVTQEELKRIALLKEQLSSQESKDAFDLKARQMLKDKHFTAEESKELGLFSDKLIAQERVESETLSIIFKPKAFRPDTTEQ